MIKSSVALLLALAQAAFSSNHLLGERVLPSSPQAITWLYSRNLSKATAFLENVVGIPMIFDGGASQWKGCKVHAPSGERSWFIGVCDIRDAPTSMNEASVTVTLVSGDRRGVDSWHKHLSMMSPAQINITEPHHSVTFNCYAFNFYDVDMDSLGLYRFEIQTFEDASWPAPPILTSTLTLTPAAPQQVTWTYTKNLKAATDFLVNVLHFPLVLDQVRKLVLLNNDNNRNGRAHALYTPTHTAGNLSSWGFATLARHRRRHHQSHLHS